MNMPHCIHILVVIALGLVAIPRDLPAQTGERVVPIPEAIQPSTSKPTDAMADEVASAAQSLPDVVDDISFLEGLRQRGLGEWIERYQQDLSPSDVIARTLVQREMLLEQAARPDQTVEQKRSAISQANQLLIELVAEHPDHPSRFRWRLESAHDYLERLRPEVFESILLYELAGPEPGVARELAGRAVETLMSIRQEIAAAWKSVEALHEQGLVAMRTSGRLATLEMLDAQSAMLLNRGRLYAALAEQHEPSENAVAGNRSDFRPGARGFDEVHSEIIKSGCLEMPPGREAEQAGALVIAAIAARHLGRTKEANEHARRVIALLDRASGSPVRQRLRRTTLLAVLEQIRSARDAGQYEGGLVAAQHARSWCLKSRADDKAALVAVSLLESHLTYCGQANRVSPLQTSIRDWLKSAESLAPLEALSRQSPEHRDLLYSLLAPSLRMSPDSDVIMSHSSAAGGDSVACRLLVGAALADAHAAAWQKHPVNVQHLQAAEMLARQTLARPEAGSNAHFVGEMRYLLGNILALQQACPEAAQLLTQLAEQWPDHDRADAAALHAVSIAADWVRASGPSGSPASRATFIHAANLLRKRDPKNVAVPELIYAVGVALENDGRFEQAAGEYAAVPSEHSRWRDAAIGRVRCWRLALDAETAKASTLPAGTSASVEGAKAAVREICDRAKVSCASPKTSEPADSKSVSCEDGRLIYAIAELLNHPAIGGADQTVRMLTDFEKRFATCPTLLGPMLRQRILALRRLGRLQEATTAIDTYMSIEPDNAGSAMAGLLQAQYEQMQDSLKRGDEKSASASANEAVTLGRVFLDWAATKPDRTDKTDLCIAQLWYAAALLQSGRPADALTTYESVAERSSRAQALDVTMSMAMELGRADALLALDRVPEALAIYDRVWPRTTEASEAWWHALTGSLRCHARDPKQAEQVLQSIRQQKFLFPDLDAGRYKHELTGLERSLSAADPAQ